MAFFRAIGGCVYPIADISKITPSWADGAEALRKQNRETAITLRGVEGEIIVYDDELETIYKASSAILAAAPGTFMLDWFDGESSAERIEIIKHPILGWRFTLSGSPERIVLRGDYTEPSLSEAVLYPDGHVEGRDGREWPSFDAWQLDVNAQVAMERAE